MEVVISIDIGGTSTKLAKVNRAFEVLGTAMLDTTAFTNESAFFLALFEEVKSLSESGCTSEKTVAIGIGAPCGIPKEGVILGAANLPFSERVEIVRRFEEEFNVPAFLTKDSYAAALGEGVSGAAQGMRNYVFITLGTGLGCGVVIDGHVLHGEHGQAGEIGHTITMKDGRECNCGQRGCLETYVSASGIRRTAFELIAEKNTPSSLRAIAFDDLSAKMIYRAAQAGDEVALEAFSRTAETLGEELAKVVTLLEPEAVFLAGGLAKAGALLTEPAQKKMNSQLLKSFRGNTRIMLSKLEVNEAALIGAASIAWRKLITISVCP